MAEYANNGDDTDAAPGWGGRMSRAANLAGALVSVALVAGLGVWGYRLAVRDVTGVPVIRALAGPMRMAPQDPGGDNASYQGLAVNRVAAEGEAAPPPDRLVLAPRPTTLDDEDMTASDLRAAEPAAGAGTTVTDEASTEDATIEDATIDGGRIDGDRIDQAVGAALAGTGAADGEQIETAAAIAVPSLRLSPDLRPMPRPARVARAATPPDTPAPGSAPAPPGAEVDASRLGADARLVQLGAFDDADTARKEWQRLTARFGTYMAGRSPVIQQAETGGRTFYRLRAAGFRDDADARRFCSALLAEQAACIAVPVR